MTYELIVDGVGSFANYTAMASRYGVLRSMPGSQIDAMRVKLRQALNAAAVEYGIADHLFADVTALGIQIDKHAKAQGHSFYGKALHEGLAAYQDSIRAQDPSQTRIRRIER